MPRSPLVSCVRRPLAILAIACSALVASGCDGRLPTDPSPENSTNLWAVTRGSSNVLGPLAQAGDGSWSFAFPMGPHDSVNYVLHGHAGSIATGGTLTITFRVESLDGTSYAAMSGGASAYVTPYLERRGTGYSAGEADNRWWAGGQRHQLGVGDNSTVTLSVPLVADAWSNVFGQRNRAAFEATLADPGAFGITFGGVHDYGHGVNLERGAAQFVITYAGFSGSD